MEKLQAALDKARSKRQDNQVAVPRTRALPAGAAAPQLDEVDALWEAIPKISLSNQALRKHRVVSRTASESTTHFDILRTKLILNMQNNGWTRLAITSPMARSGKSTTASNLAIGLGRQSNLRTILFDLDMGSPSIHEFFEHPGTRPVSDILKGKCGFEEQAVRIADNVAVAMSSVMERDPTSILLAEQTAEVLEDIQKRYQPNIMIFDLPSVLVNDNARAFLKNVDCALIMAWAGVTRYGQFDVCEQEVNHYTNVIGVVLNACRHGVADNDFD